MSAKREQWSYDIDSYDTTGIVRSLWFFKPFRRWYVDWINRVLPRSHQITLDRNRIFVFPTSQGLLFVICAVAVFIGGTNYENNLILAVGFLLFSVFLVTIWHSFLNMLGLSIVAGNSEPVFCDEYASFRVTLKRPSNKAIYAIRLLWPFSNNNLVNISENQQENVVVSTPAKKRGRFFPPRLTIETRFPLGTIRCWSHVSLDMSCIVYPKPIANSVYLSGSSGTTGTQIDHQSNEDFYELRKYQDGDNLSRIAWKSYSKGLGLMTKSYAGYVEEATWLKWDDFSAYETELRLSYLCYWVLKCHRENRLYGLEIPNEKISPAIGGQHRDACLTALALFEED